MRFQLHEFNIHKNSLSSSINMICTYFGATAIAREIGPSFSVYMHNNTDLEEMACTCLADFFK